MATDWRVLIDDTGNLVTGGWPSVCSDEEDRCVLHEHGFIQEFWSGPNLHEAKAIAALAADYMNGKLPADAASEIERLQAEMESAYQRVEQLEAYITEEVGDPLPAPTGGE